MAKRKYLFTRRHGKVRVGLGGLRRGKLVRIKRKGK